MSITVDPFTVTGFESIDNILVNYSLGFVISDLALFATIGWTAVVLILSNAL